nr:hypothetical protein [candidate division Zixibacteria bacterium]
MKAIILNSRQSSRPIGTDPWIQCTRQAANEAASRGYTLLNSVGMNSWEIGLSLSLELRLPIRLIVPLDKSREPEEIKKYYIEQFDLSRSNIEWLFLESKSRGDHRQLFPQERDRIIINEADIIYPVSIRPGGNLEELINKASGTGKKIVTRFQVPYADKHHPCNSGPNLKQLDPTIDTKLPGFLIHWTRGVTGPWPGERYIDYYRAITGSNHHYPRNALETLLRILREQRLRASSRHQRAGIEAVSFSSLPPTAAAGLMKWRARYSEMTFEPYGLAFDGNFAGTIGIRKVFYGSSEMCRYLDNNDKPYYQNIGTIGNWMPEKEYRHIGDIDLTCLPRDRMAFIVRKKEEIASVKSLFNGPVLNLEK